MRDGLIASIIGALLFTAFGAIAVPVGADTPGCVSRAEFREVKPLPRGEWTVREVRRLFDTRGVRVPAQYPSERIRFYNACGKEVRVKIKFGFYHVWLAEWKSGPRRW
jgi:hypothetical protein